jgi:sugar phosphate isomerase/epimerase
MSSQDLPAWQIGLSTGCFYRTSILDCLEEVRREGFQLIEVCSFPAHLDYHDVSLVKQAGSRMHELGLVAYSFHAPFAGHIDVTALSYLERIVARDEIYRAADAAKELGVRYLVIHPGPERDGIPKSERYERMENAAQTLNEVSCYCREAGVGFVLENMLPHLFSGHIRDLMWILGALQTTDVGICLDTGHAYLSGDVHTVAQKLSGHLWMVHASDNNGNYDDHFPPGDGKVPWQALWRQLQTVRFSGAIILEIAGNETIPVTLEKAHRGRRFLQQLNHDLQSPEDGEISMQI